MGKMGRNDQRAKEIPMSKRRTRARSSRQSTNRRRTTRSATRTVDDGAIAIIPRVLKAAVNGVELVAVGALQFTRDVLLSAVSGAASIGAEALTATTAGARGVVSAGSR